MRTSQVAKGPFTSSIMTNGIRIQEGGAAAKEGGAGPTDALMEADEELARSMQAKMDAEQYGAGARCAA